MTPRPATSVEPLDQIAMQRWATLPAPARRLARAGVPVARTYVYTRRTHPNYRAQKSAWLDFITEVTEQLDPVVVVQTLEAVRLLVGAGVTGAQLDALTEAPPVVYARGELIGTGEVCDALGINRATLHRRVAAGRDPQPVDRLAGGTMLFTRADLDRALAAVDGEVRS